MSYFVKELGVGVARSQKILEAEPIVIRKKCGEYFCSVELISCTPYRQSISIGLFCSSHPGLENSFPLVLGLFLNQVLD